MDNEKQIRDLVTRSKNVFLRDAIPELSEKRQYVLEEEFAKTKKNRSIFVWVSLAALVIFFGLTTVILTTSIQKSAENIQVRLEDFEDVNLQDVLDRAKRLENAIRDIQMALTRLKEERDTALNSIRQDASRKKELIGNQRISEAEKRRRIRDVDNEAAKAEELVSLEYDEKISELEVELASLQAEMEQYDARRLAQAREQEQILNNQKQLFQMEQDKLVNDYEDRLTQLHSSYQNDLAQAKEYQENLVRIIEERHREEMQDLVLKYNPIFSEGPVSEILAKTVPARESASLELLLPSETLARERVLSPEEYQNILSYIERLSVILSELGKIPYENSVPPSLKHLENSAIEVLMGFNKLLEKTSSVLDQRSRTVRALETQISQYQFALDHMVRENRENGYVIDARNPKDILYYLHDLHLVKEGDSGIVFRLDNELIGKVVFVREGGRFKASLSELADQRKPMQPFDKILLEVRQETE